MRGVEHQVGPALRQEGVQRRLGKASHLDGEGVLQLTEEMHTPFLSGDRGNHLIAGVKQGTRQDGPF